MASTLVRVPPPHRVKVILVSSEKDVAAQFQVDALSSVTELAATFVTCDDAAEVLHLYHAERIIVDFRPQSAVGCPARLFDQLTRSSQSRPAVLAIGNRAYELSWALNAHLSVRAKLDGNPTAEALAGLIASCQTLERSQEPWRMEASGQCYESHSPEMREMLDQLVMMATHDVTVLLVGETGTGKTTLARMVHALSPRRHEPFQSLACGAVAPDQLESELYGSSKQVSGHDGFRAGKLELAAGGTLFLDEIDLLAPAQQATLLKLIETGEYELADHSGTRHSQARLIVASNVNLKGLMERAEFRADLYYRLNVLEFPILPLRNRRMDIAPLALKFVDEFRNQHGISISRIHPEFLSLLGRYDWPGNVRELKNHIRRAVLFCGTGELTPSELPPGLLASIQETQSRQVARPGPASLFEQVASTEQEILEAELRKHGFRRTATAAALGISRVGLYKKMKKYGLLDKTRNPAPRPSSR